MKLTVNTEKLKDMVAKAVKGASNNKLLPITCMLGIKLKDGKLTLTTTDSTNYLYIIEDAIEGEDFNVTVYAEIFSKLISRMTCLTVTMELTDKCLEVIGNGTYKIELPFDENGKLVEFIDPVSKLTAVTELSPIKWITIQTILSAVKPALAVTYETPQYTNYWVGDSVIATDSYKVSAYNVPVFEKPRLISAEMMELLSVMTAEEIAVKESGDILVFESSNCIVYGKTPAGLSDYSIDAIKGLIALDFASSCEVNRGVLLQLLDRLSLFVRPFDDGNIKLAFTGDGLVVTSMADSGSELIPYASTDNIADFSCSVNINLLQTQIKSNIGDNVKFSFGREECLKLTDGMITKIVALND